MQDVLPVSAAYVPAAQPMQAADPVLPDTPTYLPALHGMQSEAMIAACRGHVLARRAVDAVRRLVAPC